MDGTQSDHYGRKSLPYESFLSAPVRAIMSYWVFICLFARFFETGASIGAITMPERCKPFCDQRSMGDETSPTTDFGVEEFYTAFEISQKPTTIGILALDVARYLLIFSVLILGHTWP